LDDWCLTARQHTKGVADMPFNTNQPILYVLWVTRRRRGGRLTPARQKTSDQLPETHTLTEINERMAKFDLIDWCFTARQHKIRQFVPIYQGMAKYRVRRTQCNYMWQVNTQYGQPDTPPQSMFGKYHPHS